MTDEAETAANLMGRLDPTAVLSPLSIWDHPTL
jgi:hypothetical protein